MEREKLLHYLAPCSFLCYTCLALRDGAFSECAPRLLAYSEDVCEFLTESFRLPPGEQKEQEAFFDAFYGTLGQLSGGGCHGCRSDAALKRGCLSGCGISDCVREREIDFCAQCEEFPCRKAEEFFGKDPPACSGAGRRVAGESGGWTPGAILKR
ncbi:MAG: DUF3795 domain-containing protein [Provencibacterium sp.]|jgi:hypothetical protein|nr:DUF3795 domain-containing protein [Provencibacterium sp.]